MTTSNSPVPSSNDHPSWEQSMQSASGQLKVEPQPASWTRVRQMLDTSSSPVEHHDRAFRISPLLRVAAVICLAFGLWYLFKPAHLEGTLVQSESLPDSPAYFASYLQVSQSLEGRPAISEGNRSARFRDGFTGAETHDDSASAL